MNHSVEKSLALAKHRGEGNLSVGDVKLGIEMGYGLSLSGYGQRDTVNVRKIGKGYRSNVNVIELAKNGEKKKKKS